MGKRSGKRRTGDARLRVVNGQGSGSGGRSGRGRTATQASAELQPLMVELRQRMRSDDPWDLLGLLTTMVHVATNGAVSEGPTMPALEALVESLIGVNLAETTAALGVLQAIAPDEDLRDWMGEQLRRRTHPMPLWIKHIDETHITRATIMTDPSGIADNILLGVQWAGAPECTFIVLVSHALGTVVKDAFPLPQSFDQTLAQYRELAGRDPIQFDALELGDARGLIEEALDSADALEREGGLEFDPENDAWPSSRPVLDWFLRLMPEPDDLYDLDDLDDLDDELEGAMDMFVAEHVAAIEAFAASPGAAKAGLDVLGEGVDVEALRLVASFGLALPDDDAVAWSPEHLKYVLTDTLPRWVLFDDATAERIPLILKEFAVWQLTEAGEPKARLTAARRAVTVNTPAFLAIVRSDEARRLREATTAYRARTGFDESGMVIVGPDPTPAPPA